MSNQSFSSPARVVREGQRGVVSRPIVVPQRHNNVHKVFAGTQLHNVKVAPPKPAAQPIQKSMPIAKHSSAINQIRHADDQPKKPMVHLDDISASAPQKAIAQKKPEIKHEQRHGLTPAIIQQQLQQMTSVKAATVKPTTNPIAPTPAKSVAKTVAQTKSVATSKPTIDASEPLLAEPKKRLTRKTRAFKKARAKAEKAEKIKKTETARMQKAVKSAALSQATATAQQQVLAPATASAATMATATAGAVASGGGSSQSGFMTRVASAPRITLTFKVDAAKFFAVLRALIVAAILAISGYLAWDTWMTNKSIEGAFSNPAAAMSVDSTNPATADPTSISNESWAAYTTPADQPRYIYIPSINVKARVMSAGVTSKGGIDTPKNLNDTAWYDGSAKPNMAGQVFIDGHTSFSNAVAAAFNDLPKLEQNAQITVETGNGNKVNYRVVNTETVASDAVDMNKALSPPEGSEKGLTLMTCTGKFDYKAQDSSHRFIVYAAQE